MAIGNRQSQNQQAIEIGNSIVDSGTPARIGVVTP